MAMHTISCATTIFDAKNYFNTGTKGALHQNQFGGTVGSRILRDRLFYFVDYQGTRETHGAQTNVPVPSDAMRGGDFSGAAAIGFDPLSGTCPRRRRHRRRREHGPNPDQAARLLPSPMASPTVSRVAPIDRPSAFFPIR